MKRLFCAICLCFLSMSSFATNWYMDSAASAGNDGTSWGDAWETFGDVVWGGAGVVAGDTLYISGGATSKTYTATAEYMLTVGVSGTAESPVTVATGAKSSAPTGHDGTVIFEGSDSWWGLVYANNRSYIVIDGEKSGSRNWTFQNCTTVADAAAVVIPGGTGNKLTYVTITAVGMGVWATYADELEISYCSITDVRRDNAIRCIVANSDATEFGLTKIHHNTIQTNYNTVDGAGPDGIQSGMSTDIYNNYFYTAEGVQVGGQHPDMCQTAGKYHRIYNNIFRNAVDSTIDIGIDNAWGGHWIHCWIYNNIFTSDSDATMPAGTATGIRAYVPNDNPIDDIKICNNTFVDRTGITGGNQINLTLNGTEEVTNSLIQNNLFYNCAKSSYYLVNIGTTLNGADWNVDYNLTNAGASGVATMWVDGELYTQDHPRTTAPTFVSYVEMNPANDYHLATEDTGARGQGVDLSAYFTTDKEGVTRSAWDIGAYEYDSGNPPPLPGSAKFVMVLLSQIQVMPIFWAWYAMAWAVLGRILLRL